MLTLLLYAEVKDGFQVCVVAYCQFAGTVPEAGTRDHGSHPSNEVVVVMVVVFLPITVWVLNDQLTAPEPGVARPSSESRFATEVAAAGGAVMCAGTVNVQATVIRDAKERKA